MNKHSTGSTQTVNATDWAALAAMPDSAIQHHADSPRTQVTDWDNAAIRQAGVEVGRVKVRGAQKAPLKKATSVRLDEDILTRFKAQGRGWQTRMNNALRDWLKDHPSV